LVMLESKLYSGALLRFNACVLGVVDWMLVLCLCRSRACKTLVCAVLVVSFVCMTWFVRCARWMSWIMVCKA